MRCNKKGGKIVNFFMVGMTLFEQTEASLFNKRLMLSSSFSCDQIYKYEIYDFSHTLLCYLSQT